jgi:hypothetical protein
MNQYLLRQGSSHELQLFSHIIEFVLKRNNSIQLNSFTPSSCDYVRFYYVLDGKFEWFIQQEHYISLRKNADSVAFGTFLLSATEMGIYKNMAEAVQAVSLSDQYFPKKQQHQVYMKYFKIFEQLSTKLADEFEDISNLQ